MKKTMPASRYQEFPGKNAVELSPMLTTTEVGLILHIHNNTLRRWSDKGLIRAYRIGPRGDRRFKREDIVTLILEVTS